MARKPTLGLGMLSWRSHKTLSKTLDSYARADLFSRFDQTLLYFNGIDEQDRELARSRGLPFDGGPNCGIASGMSALARSLNTDLVLLVQNDCPLAEVGETIDSQLDEAVHLIDCETAQIVRMRHRFAVGEGFGGVKKYLNYYPTCSVHPEFRINEHPIRESDFASSLAKRWKRLVRPGKAKRLVGRSIYVEQFSEQLYPRVIERAGNTMLVDSSVLNFTDQSVLVRKKFFLDVLMRYVESHPSPRRLNGFQVPEICLNCRWWRNQHFKIGQPRGLFTHNRFDGSFRSEHMAYESLAQTDGRAA